MILQARNTKKVKHLQLGYTEGIHLIIYLSDRKMTLDPYQNVNFFEDLLKLNLEVVLELGWKELTKRVIFLSCS